MTFVSITQCATCENKYYLKKRENSEVVDCIFKDIPFCITLDLQTGKCAFCNKQYYINSSGDCKYSNFINHCLVYDGLNTC